MEDYSARQCPEFGVEQVDLKPGFAVLSAVDSEGMCDLFLDHDDWHFRRRAHHPGGHLDDERRTQVKCHEDLQALGSFGFIWCHRSSIALALRGIRLHRSRLELTEEDRYRVADDAIRKLRQYGQWNELDDVIEPPIGATRPLKFRRKVGCPTDFRVP